MKVAVAGKYAQIRIKLCDLADNLAEKDADVVLCVLNKILPVIKDKVELLSTDLDITSNYTHHLVEMEEKEMQQKNGQRISVVEKDWKKYTAENKTMRAEIVKLADDNLKLRQDF